MPIVLGSHKLGVFRNSVSWRRYCRHQFSRGQSRIWLPSQIFVRQKSAEKIPASRNRNLPSDNDWCNDDIWYSDCRVDKNCAVL